MPPGSGGAIRARPWPGCARSRQSVPGVAGSSAWPAPSAMRPCPSVRASRYRQGLVLVLATATLISATLGARDALDRESAELRELARQNGDRQVLTVADRADGLLALGEGRLDDALLHLEPLAEDLLLGRGPWDAVPMGRADLVEALVRSGEPDPRRRGGSRPRPDAAPLPDPFAARSWPGRGAWSTSGRCARAALEAAIAGFREAGDPFERRGPSCSSGSCTAAAPGPASPSRAPLGCGDVRAHGRRAVDVAGAGGAACDPGRCARPALDSLARLTPQERRVAAAVAAGASDRQVAAELFLSHRTVGLPPRIDLPEARGVQPHRTGRHAWHTRRPRTDSAQAGPG